MTQPTREEALSMAREAGFYAHPNEHRTQVCLPDAVEVLVALAYKRGVEDEREACAKVCEQTPKMRAYQHGMAVQDECAAAIRNRSKS